MKEYAPDRWKIIKLYGENIPTTYKVFACWYGGYLNGDSWKMNSGIKSAKKEENIWIFESFSGSVYRCHVDCYGINMYGHGVLETFKKQAKEVKITISVLDPILDWSKINYEENAQIKLKTN